MNEDDSQMERSLQSIVLQIRGRAEVVLQWKIPSKSFLRKEPGILSLPLYINHVK